MRDRLHIQEFMILASGGVPIFHYSVDGTKKLNELLTGFLSAITSFASEFGERSVQSLSFEGSEILYEHAEKNTIFILLVDSGAPKHILRAVLRDLSRKFFLQYEKALSQAILFQEAFEDFQEEVERAIGYYQGVLAVTSNLSSHVVPEINEKTYELFVQSSDLLDEFHRTFVAGGRVVELIDGKTTIYEISQKTGLDITNVLRIIEFLTIWGVLKIYRLCPLVQKDDTRFDAFLDLIGLPQKEYILLQRAKRLCNGLRSLEEISERLQVVPEQLYEVLSKLGEQIKWRKVELGTISHQ